jgi:hypothetical protein
MDHSTINLIPHPTNSIQNRIPLPNHYINMAPTTNNGSPSNIERRPAPLNKDEQEALLAKLTEWQESTKDGRPHILKTVIADAWLVAPATELLFKKERKTVSLSLVIVADTDHRPDV